MDIMISLMHETNTKQVVNQPVLNQPSLIAFKRQDYIYVIDMNDIEDAVLIKMKKFLVGELYKMESGRDMVHEAIRRINTVLEQRVNERACV